jgi:hypothetical protein
MHTTTITNSPPLDLVSPKELENAILGQLAKWQRTCEVKLYALAIRGPLIHLMVSFPRDNRAEFMRNLTESIQNQFRHYQALIKDHLSKEPSRVKELPRDPMLSPMVTAEIVKT